jgi:hypothetical protein
MNLPITAPADPRRRASGSDLDIDYGIDAPGVRRGMFSAAGGGAALAIVGALLIHRSTGMAAVAAQIACGLGVLATLYGTGMGAYMTFSSRITKRRTRERLLDLAHTVAPWTGDEHVLDVGCGRGLMMIGAARRLSTGTAVGVDLWRAEDQDSNTRDATEENARRAGVAERVRVETGDAAHCRSRMAPSMSCSRTGSCTICRTPVLARASLTRCCVCSGVAACWSSPTSRTCQSIARTSSHMVQ